MADNPRELIRAAQAAELQGDMTRAADCLEQAAALYQKSGHTSRASQLQRQARQLKTRSPDVSPAFAAMAGGKDAMAYRSLASVTWSDAVSAASNEKAEGAPHGSTGEAGARRPTTGRHEAVEPGSQQPTGRHEAVEAGGPQRSTGRHEAVEPGGLPPLAGHDEANESGGLPSLAGRVEALGSGGLPPLAGRIEAIGSGRLTPAPVPPGAAGLPPLTERIAAVVLEGASRPSSGLEAVAAGPSDRAAPAQLAEALGHSDAVQAPASARPDDDDALQPGGLLSPPEDDDVIVPGGLLRPPDEDEFPEAVRPAQGRRREKRLIERGPTRADPALDAWCSFCCRPRGEVGDLVAGPAGAFICKGCLGESQGLLGDVVPRAPMRKPVEDATAGGVEMVGHDDVRTLLERTLQAGARCLLLVGPEGCGKSVFFQAVQRRGQGALTSVEALESAPGADVLLVEDVDRLESGAQAALVTFLVNHPERAVVMSARGAVASLGLWVRGEGGSLPVPTTAGLMDAVQGSVPVALLERVQVLLPVRRPTVPELVEVARRSLALRRPAVSLSEEVLGAFAAEAVRSPRAGHELRALLSRVYAGSWSLEAAQTPAPTPSHNSRGGRKGTP
ncbi:hypothetical protein OV207_20540 [Corallococcus sp. BB11-1]|uniref:ClpX C4-type zinc finger protein n=1 Tax=Corallococcus sp. BB11-1 TaxID=2996783 RepID=UPI00226FD498|nr:ClpX C4-type zinc finger protein [Corallococcus sp. BB11-1]MCY1033853.1 hypothetical protein [Corallococcus sp. BB11-1]